MTKVVLDTNIVISGMFWKLGSPFKVLKLFFDAKIEVVISEPLFVEMRRKAYDVRKRYHYDVAIIRETTALFQNSGRWVVDLPSIAVCRDSKDNMVLATALAGEAEYIVTGDKDLLDIKRYKGIKIVTANEFLKAI